MSKKDIQEYNIYNKHYNIYNKIKLILNDK